MSSAADIKKAVSDLRGSSDPAVRKHALYVLRNQQHPKILELIHHVHQTDADEDVRRMAGQIVMDYLPQDAEKAKGEMWVCGVCGAENGKREVCGFCGATASKLKNEVSGDIFLLHSGAIPSYLFFQMLSDLPKMLSCFYVMLFPFICAGILIAFFTVTSWIDWRRLSDGGVITQAEFIDRREERSTRNTSYYVTYRFIHNDIPYVREQSVSYATYIGTENGQRVTVMYLPDDPNVSNLGSTPDSPIPITLFAVVWNGFLVTFIYLPYRKQREQRYISQHGQIISGEVITSRSYDVRSSHFVEVRYRFVPPQTGREISRKERAVRGDLVGASLPEAGTPVQVLYVDDKRFRVL